MTAGRGDRWERETINVSPIEAGPLRIELMNSSRLEVALNETARPTHRHPLKIRQRRRPGTVRFASTGSPGARPKLALEDSPDDAAHAAIRA